MKTKFLFGALAAFGMMTACSSDDETADLEKPTGEGVESYVSFSVVSNNASGTRADDLSSADKDAEFEEAKGNEAKIDNVVLLFYDNSGNAINVNMGSSNTNYKVILSPELTGSKEPVGSDYNVEHWFQKTVAITTASTLKNARVLAVVNANIKDGLLCDKAGKVISGSISKKTFYDSVFPGDYSEDLFVMSTSVYASDTSTTATVISDVAINIFDTESAAAADPAIIYVERVKARAKVIAGTNVDAKSLYTVDLKGVDLPSEEKDKTFKIKVLGWDLNTTTINAYLFKHLDNSYGYGFTWNDPALHRSYWEASLGSSDASAYNSSFTPDNITSQPGDSFKYCNPNTSNVKTKVLVYTQLVQADGTTPADIATWYGNNYTLAGLKTAILAASPKHVFVADATEENKYVNVDEKYVDFRQGKGTSADMDKSWMAYPILKTKFNEADSEDIAYYKEVEDSGIGGTGTKLVKITVAEAMQLIGFQDEKGLNKLQGAKIWNEGHAYYFVDVNHLGAQKAMVRNHSYTIRIDGFEGLGTPIFNPDEVIPEPTLPEGDKKSYVSVTMNVLSWRIIPTQSVIFGKEEEKK